MAESIQKVLTRQRPPRVKITYDVETGGAIIKTELPFVMGIIADLSGEKKLDRATKKILEDGRPREVKHSLREYRERDFIDIDKDNFDKVLADFAPRVAMKLPGMKKDAEGKDVDVSVNIRFDCLEDFRPDNLIDNIYLVDGDGKPVVGEDKKPDNPFREMLDARNAVRDYYTKLDSNDKLHEQCLKYLQEQTPPLSEPNQPFAALKDGFRESFEKYLTDNMDTLTTALSDAANKGSLVKILMQRVAAADEVMSGEMNVILHHKDFQALESAWRGLFYLVHNTETGTGLKLRVLNACADEVKDDLRKAIDFDQSFLFKKIYEETYGTQGGNPYSCLLYAREFDMEKDSVEILTELMKVAAAAHAPLLTAASPKLFDMQDDDFRGLSNPIDLAKIFEGADYTSWRSLREQEDARYLNLVLPRILLRVPYRDTDVGSFAYEEGMGEEASMLGVPPVPCHASYLWGNAAYALGLCITRAYAMYKWTAAIRGVEGGGLVEGLPMHTYTRPTGDRVNRIPTELAITDRREKELSDLGFIGLCYRLNTDRAAFFGGQSLHKPPVYFDDSANANAKLSARLPYLLNASRFAHYMKSIMRDKVGSFLDRGSVEEYLNTWLSNYVLLSDSAPQAIKAQYPLREARADVTDEPGSPGAYRVVMYLRPHFQMEELTISIRLVAKIPPPAA